MTSPGIRLQKVLARAGLGSRRACEEMIRDGRVAVDGEVARLGRRVDPETQRITLDGVPVPSRQDLAYFLLNKPTGVITTVDDPQGRPTVIDLVPDDPRVVPAGRLDADTEGLLVVTNDGDLIQGLTHPSRGVEKEYLAEVEGVPDASALHRLREGIELDDGPTAPAEVTLVDQRPARAALRVVIHEGRNRQVRRMCAAVGHEVLRLVRTRIGPLTDTELGPGEWRVLTVEEIRALYRAAGAGEVEPGPREAEG